MKILVFSDSHHRLGNMYDAVEAEMPELIFHLGDHITDAEDLSCAFCEPELCYVPGNCDFGSVAAASLLREVGGVRIFLTHGHLFGVKSGLSRLQQHAKQIGAQLVLFGHTHIPLCEQHDGIWYLNPGTSGAGGRCYGAVHIESGKFQCELRNFP